MGINGGRNERGVEGDPAEEGLYLRVNISMPPSLMKRLDKYMKKEDRQGERTRDRCLHDNNGHP